MTTTANWCVLIAACLPILCVGAAKFPGVGKPRREGGFDNHSPRDWQAKQEGWQKRLISAQANGFEALPFFIGAVAIAQNAAGADQSRIDMLAVGFVLARLAYIAMYALDKATLRSLVWAAGFALNIAILLT